MSYPVTTLTWAIANLERETEDGFVFAAHYTVSAADGTYSAGAYCSIGFERPENLVPYDELTQDEVIGWVKEALNAENEGRTEEIEGALQSQLNEKHVPTKASGTPWASSGTPWAS